MNPRPVCRTFEIDDDQCYPTLICLIFPDGHPSTVTGRGWQEYTVSDIVTSEQLQIRQQSQHAVVTFS